MIPPVDGGTPAPLYGNNALPPPATRVASASHVNKAVALYLPGFCGTRSCSVVLRRALGSICNGHPASEIDLKQVLTIAITECSMVRRASNQVVGKFEFPRPGLPPICQTANQLDCGNIDLDITSKGGGVDRFDNTLHVWVQLRPLLAPKNHNCDFSAREVLLIANILVRR
jgi:hypothetical protein